MWGDVTNKKMIYVDGKQFMVGRNLRDALRFLKRRSQRQRYWIDAICINQNDIAERNRQLRNMPQIYKRADRTLIWLGQKCFENHPKPASNVAIESSQKARNWKLWADPYWDRVWIVQELSLTTNIHVCYGKEEHDWEIFLRQIELYVDDHATRGPTKLERQRRERYELGHTLLRLLETHQNAVCKDPRDKIYGFVGLAVDGHGLPMDYQKTTFEVWKDTMLFLNSTEEFSRNGNNIFSFSNLVKRLLGGNDVAAMDRVVQEYASWIGLPVNTDISDNAFKVPVSLVGAIVHIGPSPKQMRSTLEREREWTAQVSNTFSNDVGAATLENDLLMQALLSRDDIDSGLLTFPTPRMRWSFQSNHTSKRHKYWQDNYAIMRNRAKSATQRIKPPISEAVTSTLEPHLFQLVKVDSSRTPWKMGVAAGNARPGDWICWMEEVQKAVIIRFDEEREDVWVRIVGTAKFTKHICKQAMVPGDRTEKQDFYLRMDVETAYILLT